MRNVQGDKTKKCRNIECGEETFCSLVTDATIIECQWGAVDMGSGNAAKDNVLFRGCV